MALNPCHWLPNAAKVALRRRGSVSISTNDQSSKPGNSFGASLPVATGSLTPKIGLGSSFPANLGNGKVGPGGRPVGAPLHPTRRFPGAISLHYQYATTKTSASSDGRRASGVGT